jgi:hypothetical protein
LSLWCQEESRLLLDGASAGLAAEPFIVPVLAETLRPLLARLGVDGPGAARRASRAPPAASG